MAPGFFDREIFGKQVLTYPDRTRLTVEAVKAGKSVMFLGGWYSFTGELGKGGWGRTPLAEILPVQCLEYDDLRESTEGFTPYVTSDGEKHLSKMLDFNTCPPILGYNQTVQLFDSIVLMRLKETDDPLLVTRVIGKGKTLAYTSDLAPHWGCNFVYWKITSTFLVKMPRLSNREIYLTLNSCLE